MKTSRKFNPNGLKQLSCQFTLLLFLVFLFAGCAQAAVSASNEPASRAAENQPQPQPAANISVETGPHARLNTPVSVSLERLGLRIPGSAFQLVETTGGTAQPVAAQFIPGNPDRLAWILEGQTPAHSTRTFTLEVAKPVADVQEDHPPAILLHDNGDDLLVTIGNRPVLNYRYTLKDVPEGVDPIYRRSGFIHPLWTPGGTRLTRIQPTDHYHHYGIWNPWTHTDYEGTEIDFWNLRKNQGTVVARQLYERRNGEITGGFKALQDHVLIMGPTGLKPVLNEQLMVDVWKADPDDSYWIVDVTSLQNAATAKPLTVKEYRYQGFSIRANEAWYDGNVTILTSEGLNKSNANATRARWIDVRGPSVVERQEAGTAGVTGDLVRPGDMGTPIAVEDAVRSETSGILMMTHPSNFNFPELLRIWPVGNNRGRENVFVNFNPAQDRDLVIEPGNTYVFRYRMIVYDGKLDAGQAERFWNNYAYPPLITLEPAQN